jgi:1-deoxy-D-xylulose-5-phosphate synthase
VGADGATHQGLWDISFFRNLPNTIVMAPKDENELQHMLATAIEYPGPAALRFPRGSGVGVPLDPDIKALPIGEAELLRDGDDVVIAAIGIMVHPAMEAAEELAAQGVSAAVLNARFVRPLDEARIHSLVEQCGAVVTLEEHRGAGGFGSAVLEMLARDSVVVPIRCLGVDMEMVEHGETRESVGLATADIVAAALELVRGRGGADGSA